MSRLLGVAAGPFTEADFDAAIAELLRPHVPCGTRERPHIISPKPTRWPHCVSCGAGSLDAMFAAELERMGESTDDIPNIAGQPIG